MIRIFGTQFLKIGVLPNKRCAIIRNICASSCTRYSKYSAQEIAERKQKDDEMRWTKFYHFSNMKYHAIVTRLKIYPPLSALFLTPVCLVMESQGMIPPYTFIACLGCGKNSIHSFEKLRFLFPFFCSPGIIGTIPLSVYSATIANTIGVIYICKEYKNLQIGYIDFMGRQHFVETTVDELRKCQKGPVKYGRYKTITLNVDNKQKVLKLPWETGDIYDIKLFRRLFGK